jgi:hypothetical protein
MTPDCGTIEEDGLTPILRLRKGDVYEFGRVELPVRENDRLHQRCDGIGRVMTALPAESTRTEMWPWS